MTVSVLQFQMKKAFQSLKCMFRYVIGINVFFFEINLLTNSVFLSTPTFRSALPYQNVFVAGKAEELPMGLHGVAYLPTRASFAPRFIKIEVEVKASVPPHVLKLSLGVSKGMLPIQILLMVHLFNKYKSGYRV